MRVAAGMADFPMAQPRQDYHNTVPIANTAMRKIDALGQPADPRSYALWFKYAEAPRLAGVPDDFESDSRTKAVAALSLLIWAIVIVLGRFLPFVSKSTS